MTAQDLRYAWRTMRQNVTLTITIVCTLALGIGANTAMFSVLNAITLKAPLAVPNPDQLYTINRGRFIASGPDSARFSGPMFEALKTGAPAGVGVAAMSRGIARVYVRNEDERETTPASLQLVSTNFFQVVDLATSLGTTFRADGNAETNEPLAILSYGYWQRHFNGSPSVIGRTLTINNATFTIAGVGPRDFVGVWLETPVDLWVPLSQQSAIKYSRSFSADGAALSKPWFPQPQIWWLHVVVRAPRETASAARGAFAASLASVPPSDSQISLDPFARGFSRVRQQFSTPLIALMMMASLVLLVACANVANVLLARAAGRQREVAVRVALGANRARLVKQLLIESALLVTIAAAAAILLAAWVGDVLVRLATASTEGPAPFVAAVDLRVLAFAAGVAFLSVMTFGLWPAWRATRVDIVSALKASSRGTVGRGVRPARVLVMAQVAFTLVLVTGTGLFVRSFQNLLSTGLGFESERVVTATIEPNLSGIPNERLPAMYERILDALAAVPGVESAALAMCGLQGPCARDDGFEIEGYRPRGGGKALVSVNAVTPDYLSTLGMRVLAGRTLTSADRPDTQRVAVVNKALATRYFGDLQRSIGRHMASGSLSMEIVGVVDDIRALGDLKAAPMPSVFLSLGQQAVVPRALEVRTTIEPAAAVAAVRRAIADAAPELPVESIETVTTRVERGTSQDRLIVLLTSGFSLLAIGLAGLGLFGVLSYAVARRTPELGVRLALGASPSSVRWSVVRDSLGLVVGGVLLGLPFVALGMRVMPALLFGINPYDAVSTAAALAILLIVGTACAIVPALRAARVDPLIALRSE